MFFLCRPCSLHCATSLHQLHQLLLNNVSVASFQLVLWLVLQHVQLPSLLAASFAQGTDFWWLESKCRWRVESTCSGSQQTWHRKLPGAVGFAEFACWAKHGKSSPLDCAMDCAMDCTIQSAGPAKSRSSTLCGYELNPSGQERFWRPPRKLKHFWRVNKGIQRLCTQRYTKVLKNVRELRSDCALCAPHCANFNTQFRFDVGLGLLPPEANIVTLNDLTHLCSSLDQFGLSNLMLVGAIWYSLSIPLKNIKDTIAIARLLRACSSLRLESLQFYQ